MINLIFDLIHWHSAYNTTNNGRAPISKVLFRQVEMGILQRPQFEIGCAATATIRNIANSLPS